jgi:16S rRNA (guanine527-N7)-methyltransferase
MAISNATMRSVLSEYGAIPSDDMCEKIRTYISILLLWNESVSLTAITDELEILRFHFGESLFALSSVPALESRLADVGPGAGFPGLPLRIFNENIGLTLIEANAKKCAFLSEVVRELALPDVRVLRARFEDVSDYDRSLDAIVARALGGYPELLSWSRAALSHRGRIVLWIGEREVRDLSLNRKWLWSPPLRIPGSDRRYILCGAPET